MRVCFTWVSVGFTRPGKSQMYENSPRNYFIHTIVHCLNDVFFLRKWASVCVSHPYHKSTVRKTVKDYQWFWDWACTCGACVVMKLFLSGSKVISQMAFTDNVTGSKMFFWIIEHRRAKLAEIRLHISEKHPRTLTNPPDLSKCAQTTYTEHVLIRLSYLFHCFVLFKKNSIFYQ